ncbi:MAG: 50S ribosomal protein L11 [Endomicrobium sp.]|jgi:large subunit ribosomal protein L11|nr:50S ribosomal protein L11 [Endomicrobium sp.]
MKNIKIIIKLQIQAGEANPTPPVGSALGPHGINIMNFCKQFNEKTKNLEHGIIVPTVITIFEDRTFSFITKNPPVSVLVKKIVGIAKASAIPNRNKVGKITDKQIEEIAKVKMSDLNVQGNLIAAKNMVKGTIRSMGIDIVDNEN